MLVIAEEEAIIAMTFIAPHCVDTNMLATSIVEKALISI